VGYPNLAVKTIFCAQKLRPEIVAHSAKLLSLHRAGLMGLEDLQLCAGENLTVHSPGSQFSVSENSLASLDYHILLIDAYEPDQGAGMRDWASGDRCHVCR
jgi:hypothetical protein